MNLHSPFQISARLLPALKIGNAWINLEMSPRENDGRNRYTYTIDLPNGRSYKASDLLSGCQGGTLQEGFVSLLTFLSAEAEEEGMFSRAVSKWAKQNQDEIDIIRYEIEESKRDLIED